MAFAEREHDVCREEGILSVRESVSEDTEGVDDHGEQDCRAPSRLDVDWDA